MRIVRGIPDPFRDEHVVAVDPVPSSRVEATWRMRLHLYTGRTLSDAALTQEQVHRAGLLALRSRALAPGVTGGLEAAIVHAASPEEAAILVAPGSGMAASGEDVDVRSALRLRVRDLPVIARVDALDGTPGGPTGGVLLPRRLGPGLGVLIDDGRAVGLPPVAVLVAQPVSAELLGRPDPSDPCELDPRNDAYEDWQRVDGCRLVLYAWPTETYPLPPRDRAFRNRLAWSVFDRERGFGPDEIHPWEDAGVPLAAIDFDASWAPTFVDRGMVVRTGGGARRRRPLVPDAGDERLWQARIAQFVEHHAEEAAAGDPAADRFVQLPPVGLLPAGILDFGARAQGFFPAAFRLDARPVPLEEAESAIREAASLVRIDLSNADQLQLLVPVPGEHYDPRLLHQEVLDPLFEVRIAEFAQVRADVLSGRERVRRRRDALLEAVAGERPGQVEPEPQALADEVAAGVGPIAERLHRSPARAGLHQHGFEGAHATLGLVEDDVLFAWVRLVDGAVPASVMLQFHAAGGDWEHRAAWGEARIALGTPGTPSHRRLGGLPAPGTWTRLEVSAGELGLAGRRIDGIAFTLFDGAADWAYAGRARGGADTVWVADALPPGALPEAPAGAEEGWHWTPSAATDTDPGYGTVRSADGVRTVQALEALRARWASTAAAAELAALDPLGLDAFVERLQARLARTDDRVEFGFLRVRTDMYRLRQHVLGAEEATRLATSPALAEIAERGRTAAATQQELHAFYAKAQETQVASAVPGNAPRAVPAGGAARAAASQAPAFAIGGASLLAGGLRLDTAAAEPPVALAAAKAAAAVDVIGQAPLVGLALQTVTVGERLAEPAAVETRSFAVEGKQSAVRSFADLAGSGADAGGIRLDDIELPGYQAADGEDAPTLARVAAAPDAFVDLDWAEPAQKTEAHFFEAGVRAIDNTVRLLRLVEGRAQLYRRLIEDCKAARAQIAARIAEADARLRVLEAELAAARHDVAFATALLADERARVDAINTRRADVLRTHVPWVIFRRARHAEVVVALPARTLEPTTVDDPVPACLRGSVMIPEALRRAVDLFRDAPLRWLAPLAPLLDGLDRFDVLEQALRSGKARASVLPAVPRSEPADATAGLGLAVGTALGAQAGVLALARERVLAVDLGSLARLGLAEARREALGVLALGDLLDAPLGRPALASGLAAELDRIGRVAACLYGAFDEVAPALRLRWAEMLSEFDRPAPLRDLAGLPQWGEVPLAQRRELQALVDWLYGRVDPASAEASGLVADLVRICILLASHAPVGRILAGRVESPTPLRPGARLDVTADVAQLRLGMLVRVHASDRTVLATGRVEDIVGGKARVAIAQAARGEAQATAGMRVQFHDDAAAVVLPRGG